MIALASTGRTPPERRLPHLLVLMVIAMASVLLLCGFRPVVPQVTYTRSPFDKVIGVYRNAYARTGMTVMTVTTESRQRYADGSTDTIGTYGFAYPAFARKRGKTGGIVFTVRTLLKHGVCVQCSFSCRFYTADPASDAKATAEIRRKLGQSLPAIGSGSSAGPTPPKPPFPPP